MIINLIVKKVYEKSNNIVIYLCRRQDIAIKKYITCNTVLVECFVVRYFNKNK